jgi:hypothetical protein
MAISFRREPLPSPTHGLSAIKLFFGIGNGFSYRLLHRDPDLYPDPHVFNPMRWLITAEKGLVLNKSMPDPNETYGYGRR